LGGFAAAAWHLPPGGGWGCSSLRLGGTFSRASDAIYRRAVSRYCRCDVRDTLHLDFSDMVLWGGPLRKSGALGTLPPARAIEITRFIVRQYFDQELLGRRSAMLSGKAPLPEVTVRTFPSHSTRK